MSFDTEVLRVDLIASGSVDFPFDCPIYLSANLLVYVDDILQVKDVHYVVRTSAGTAPFESLADASLPAAGIVRFITAPISGARVAIIPLQPITQLSRYSTEPLPVKRIEKDFDKVVMIARALLERIERSPVFDIPSVLRNIPIDELEVGKVLAVEAGPRIVCVEPALQGIPGLDGQDGADSTVPGPPGAGAAPLIREVDGATIVAVPTVIEFDGLDGFIVSNPFGSIARINLPFGTVGALLRAVATAAAARTILNVPLTTDVPTIAGDNVWTGRQQFKKGANIAAATTLTITTDGNYFHITGNATITDIANLQAGTEIVLVFDGTPLLVNSATLILHGSIDRQTVAGDTLVFRSEGTAWREINSSSISDESSVSSLGAVSSAAVANTTSETSLFIATIPGGTLGIHGRLLFMPIIISSESASLTAAIMVRSVTFRIKLNGSTVWTATITTRMEDIEDTGHAAIGIINNLIATLSARGSNNNQLLEVKIKGVQVFSATGVGNLDDRFLVDTTINAAVNFTIQLTAQYNGGAAPSYSTTVHHSIIEVLKAGA